MENAFEALYNFRLDLSRDEQATDGALIREMASLINDLPDCVIGRLGSRSDASHIETLLETQAFIDASVSLLGNNCGYLLTRSPTGSASAVIIIDGECDEDGYFAESQVVAILGALCGTLISMSNSVTLPTNVLQFGPR